MPALLLCACDKKADENTTRWGKTNVYDKFLWKKHVPDTLYKTLAFEFNDDAKNYATDPLKLALYKKTDSGKMLPVTENEMEVFADGKKCENNIIEIAPGTTEKKVGIVFNDGAENKVHHWYFKPIDADDFDRINDIDPDTFNAKDSSLMDIEVEKNKIMNPLAEGSLFAFALIVAALLVWMFVLKTIFFPTFRVGKVNLNDPVPFMCQKKLRGSRKMVLTNKKVNQGWLNRFFAGQIIYATNPLWTTDIVIEPKDTKSVRLRPSKEYMVDACVLKTNQEYIIRNMTTGNKTKIKIS